MKYYLIFLISFTGLLPVSGQTPDKGVEQEKIGDTLVSPTIKLSEVQVISASRRNTNAATLPYALSVVNAPSKSAIMPRSTPDALNNIPGVFVQKTNLGGGSPFLRGLTGNQTLLLIDGIRMNNSTYRYGPNQYLNTIDPFSIDKIEVLKGSGSVQYGSDALGGVIQIFTKEPSFSSQTYYSGAITARYWSQDMEKSTIGEFTIGGPKLAFSGVLAVKDFGDLVGGDTTGRQTPSGYGEHDAFLKARWQLSESSELTLANQFVQQKNVPVFHKVQLENFSLNEMGVQTRNLAYLKYIKKNNNPLFQQLNVNGSFHYTLEERNSRKNNSMTTIVESDKVNSSHLAVELFSALGRNWTANSGAEYYHDKIRSGRKSFNSEDGESASFRGLYPDGATYLNAAVYSLHHLTYGRFNLETGLRYNWIKASVHDIDLGALEVNPNAFVMNAGLGYQLNEHYFYTSFNGGYRAPNIDDMGSLGIVDFRYELPSYTLKPEKSYHTELGYKYAAGQWKVATSVYYNQLRNLITRVQTGQEIDGYKVYQKENTDKALIKGVEGSVGWNLNDKFLLDGFVSFNHGQNITGAEPLRRMPPLNGHFSASYKWPLFYVKAEIAWADHQNRLAKGDIDDNRIPVGGTPGWQVLNFYSGYKFNALQFRLGAQNLFNQDYRTHGSGVNAVGRSFWLSIAYHFSSFKTS